MKSKNGRRVASALASIVIASVCAVLPGVAAGSYPGERHAGVQLAQFGCQMFGPVATMRRANEMANQFRASGFSAIAFHNGNGYYVRVC